MNIASPELKSELVMAETVAGRVKPRPIIRIGLFIISHSTLVRYSLSHIILVVTWTLLYTSCSFNGIWWQWVTINCFVGVFQYCVLCSRGFGPLVVACSCQVYLLFWECPYARFGFFSSFRNLRGLTVLVYKELKTDWERQCRPWFVILVWTSNVDSVININSL